MTHLQPEKPELPIDYPEVLERIGGDIAFLDELLKIYFVEFDDKKAQIETALGKSNSPQLQDLGHSLKGASANLSLPALQRLSFGLEVAGRERNIEAAKRILADLIAERARLEAYLKDNPPPR